MDRRMRMNMADGRNPYGSRGGYVMNARGGRGRSNRGGRGRGDRGMDYGMYDMRGGEYDMRGGDMRRGGMDGHYPEAQGSTYYPIQAMGTFEGYYGMPGQNDYARGDRAGYDMGGYDMARGGRGRMDYGYMPYPHYPPYDYGDYGDYGEVLTEEELEHWCKKLKGKLDEREKQMLSKEVIAQKSKQMGLQMKGFGEKELEVVALMLYDDYKKTIGANPDMIIKLAHDWLNDQDAAVKGAEKLAVYYDCIVEGEDD